MYIFRQFQASDAEQIHEIARLSWHFTYKDIYSKEIIDDSVNRNYNKKYLPGLINYIEEGLTDFQVAIYQDKIIGFEQIGYDNYWLPSEASNKQIKLMRIYLHPDHIGKGVGGKLLALAEKWVGDNNFEKYHLFVHKKNTWGIEFYLKNGFKHIMEYDSISDGEWYMEKIL